MKQSVRTWMMYLMWPHANAMVRVYHHWKPIIPTREVVEIALNLKPDIPKLCILLSVKKSYSFQFYSEQQTKKLHQTVREFNAEF